MKHKKERMFHLLNNVFIRCVWLKIEVKPKKKECSAYP